MLLWVLPHIDCRRIRPFFGGCCLFLHAYSKYPYRTFVCLFPDLFLMDYFHHLERTETVGFISVSGAHQFFVCSLFVLFVCVLLGAAPFSP